MGKRLYVGSLPFEITEDRLQELFASCGRVESAKIIVDKVSGRSKGFGFVEMATDLEAQAAIQKMNGSSVGSRQIVVNEARPVEERKGGGNRGGFNGPRGEGGFGANRGGFGGGRREGGFGGGRREDGFGGKREGGFGGNREGGFGGGRRQDGFSSRADFDGRRRRDNHRGGRKHFDDNFGNR